MSKSIKLFGKTVTVNTEKLSKGLCEMHEADPDMRMRLSIGLIDHQLCEMCSKNLAESIKKEFSATTKAIYEEELDSFIKDCNNEIQKGIYSHATCMIV